MAYYFETTKKYIIAFGSFFDNIEIQRDYTPNDDTDENSLIKVPFSFGTKRKLFQQMEANWRDDQEKTSQYSTFLPRMGFTLNGIQYDPERKRQAYVELPTNDSSKIQYEGSPYIFPFTLYIWTKYFNDSLQILEQILPAFTPDLELSVNESSTLGITRDISVNLQDVDIDTDLEFGEDESRVVQHTLTFELKGYIYPPIRDAVLIKKIFNNYYASETDEFTKTELAFQNIITA